jgi:hypothetical protein
LFFLEPAFAGRIPKETVERLEENYELIRMAAWMEGVDPNLLAAVCIKESRLTPIIGGLNNKMYGSCQIHMHWWEGLLIKKYGIYKEDTILNPYFSYLSGALVLNKLQRRYPSKTVDQILCIYAIGTSAENFKKDCAYSRDVMHYLHEVKSIIKSQQQTWFYRHY